ncbi:hypothetical protein CDL12_19443 [Handroanthus impetiginosus]|uniref:Uncharacterized protein n=1 Tax=Handroanthus impetiginosus TaxID=429701 RepID=A0A2G9GSI6_9LAMI|nr:hypothetical protein CDL12_19443 [Handroanthus impetiginosus]
MYLSLGSEVFCTPSLFRALITWMESSSIGTVLFHNSPDCKESPLLLFQVTADFRSGSSLHKRLNYLYRLWPLSQLCSHHPVLLGTHGGGI